MWLRDGLPSDLEGVRVLLYGYDTTLVGSKSFQDLEALASTFRRALISLQQSVSIIPGVLFAMSLH